LIYIGLGANLPSKYGAPLPTIEAALKTLAECGVRIILLSTWHNTKAVPASNQPDYINGVAQVQTRMDPERLLYCLHQVEAFFGRKRQIVNEARPLDIDLLDYNGQIQLGPPELPHPRMHSREFVLKPLQEIAPDWVHPKTGIRIDHILKFLQR
jgi:2-amino-4-hydroxy-6-hydroxymethyldihydropteridine diphosphokinase